MGTGDVERHGQLEERETDLDSKVQSMRYEATPRLLIILSSSLFCGDTSSIRKED